MFYNVSEFNIFPTTVDNAILPVLLEIMVNSDQIN
jgi:hypothetical protein